MMVCISFSFALSVGSVAIVNAATLHADRLNHSADPDKKSVHHMMRREQVRDTSVIQGSAATAVTQTRSGSTEALAASRAEQGKQLLVELKQAEHNLQSVEQEEAKAGEEQRRVAVEDAEFSVFEAEKLAEQVQQRMKEDEEERKALQNERNALEALELLEAKRLVKEQQERKLLEEQRLQISLLRGEQIAAQKTMLNGTGGARELEKTLLSENATKQLQKLAPPNCVKFAAVGASDSPDVNFWKEKCASIPVTDPGNNWNGHGSPNFIKMQIGEIADYFKPSNGKSLCDMLVSRETHQWSNNGQEWCTPTYYTHHFGGSKAWWPRDGASSCPMLAGDGRAYLTFWGIESEQWPRMGACCQSSLLGDRAWHQTLEASYCYPQRPCTAAKSCPPGMDKCDCLEHPLE